MADPVACAQCGVRYDPSTSTFCPRCGSTARGATLPPALEVARRHDPGRRRVQASGAVLLVVGALALLALVPMTVLSGSLVPSTLDQFYEADPPIAVPGGTIEVLATQGAAPLADAPVRLVAHNGTELLAGRTDAAGRFNATAPNFVVGLVLETPSGNFTRKVVSADGFTVAVPIDVAADPPATTGWTGVGTWVLAMRILAGVLCALSLLAVLSGIAALRLRSWGLAVGGAATSMILPLILFVATFSLGTLLILLVLGLPLLFIARGRRYFGKAA